jgi:hypothetical protein
MKSKTGPARLEGRMLYVGHCLTADQVTEICRMCGILVMDLTATPTDNELRDAVRMLVREALAARVARATRRAAR